MQTFDLLVMGHDPGGIAAALLAAESGLRVALLAPNLAQKEIVLATLCEMAAEITTEKVALPTAWSTFRTRCTQSQTQAHQNCVATLQAAEVTYLQGTGSIVASGHARCQANSETFDLRAAKMILATGSRPRAVTGAPDSLKIIAAENLNRLTRCPDSALVAGSDVDALEVAWALRAFGCRVTWALPKQNSLAGFESADWALLQVELQRQGITVGEHTKTRAITVDELGVQVALDYRQTGETELVTVDCLVSAVGRRPNSAGLGLESVAVVMDKRGHIQVDSAMQTGQSGLYAVGDLLPTKSWPHVARAEGQVAGEHLLGRSRQVLRYQRIPIWTRCQPQMAAVGLTQTEAEGEGFLVRRIEHSLGEILPPTMGTPLSGRLTLILDQETKQVLGVHLLGAELGVTLAAVVEALAWPGDVARVWSNQRLEKSEVSKASAALRKMIEKAAD